MNSKNKILIIGHAGGKKAGPENTLKVFKKAIELKADYIEFDVRLSKDNEIVIIHDPDTYNASAVPGLVKNKTLRELKTLNVGEGEKIPTFREIIEIANHKINLLLHICSPNMEDQIINILREYDYIKMTIVSCMIHRYLFKYRDLEPTLWLAALENMYYKEFPTWNVRSKLINKAMNNKFYAINPEYHLVDAQFVAYAHQSNLKIFPWTINDRNDIQSLINLGIDGIITDDIPLVKNLLGR
jgi:glycerophosphoryl diester phosphodiesterase